MPRLQICASIYVFSEVLGSDSGPYMYVRVCWTRIALVVLELAVDLASNSATTASQSLSAGIKKVLPPPPTLRCITSLSPCCLPGETDLCFSHSAMVLDI